MWSYEHFIWSFLASVFFVQFMTAPATFWPAWVYIAAGLVGALIGVLIDLDHFLIARINTGNWSNLVNAVKNPSRLIGSQESVFEDGNDVTPGQRLISHSIIVAFSGLAVASVSWSSFIPALFVYWIGLNHITADLLRDEGYL